MNPAWQLAAALSRRNFLAWSAALGAAGLAGCKNAPDPAKKVQPRSQIGEDPADPDAVVTIGSKTKVGNCETIEVSGISIVYQLPGTGSSPPQGGWRTMLEDNLKKLKGDQPLNVRQLLDSPTRTASLVIVSARIPPGARKNDPVDVQVTLPQESRTTSLQGGVLFPCDLLTSDTTGNIHTQVHNGAPSGPAGRLLLGNVWAKAQGPLVAGNFEVDGGKAAPANVDADGRPVYRAGIIPGGGKVTTHRPYFLVLNESDQTAPVCASVAERLNTTFHSTSDPNLKVADAKNREYLLVNVPAAYQHNHYRFLVVARLVPYTPLAAGSRYRQKLEEELLDPVTTITAALRLEALGGDCRRSLRIGLESSSPWVRFAAAEALAYLGQTDGAGELARLAEDHPALRAQCLTALASLNDAAGTDRLVEMLTSPDAELRQGAFIALRLADEKHPALNGTLMNRSYWLHRVAGGPDAPSAVHLTGTGRSEVVLFGSVKLRGPLPPVAVGTDYTVSLPAGQAKAKVTQVVKGAEDAEVKEYTCEPTLAAVLSTLATLRGGYSEAIELVRKLARVEALDAQLVLNATPHELSVQQLCTFAKTDSTLAKANQEVARIGSVNPAVDANGFELPVVQDAPVVPAGAPLVKPPLNRDPGRLFGPKRASDAPLLDPAVVPAGGQ
ncbi:flagellar basal body P-ring protein FlgI [Frigoriglobus tundricola]|uniref:Uncharacterized protein n=1 Tax=Frigoriglobus tundricola TaxID=2774151 RepID=A0A6M5YVD3_9BACT|nr:flagellar basal body P-ring protein FlgI [Frigoriglobus tundricola]QJW97203.1 hypothetical protein FTUN_4768 [Frigoriglobus tundricola]